MKEELFPVALLAGGLATRLRPITETIPKSLVDVNGEPFIAHQLRLLKRRGIQRVIVCIGHLGEMIQDQIGDGAKYGLDVSYSSDGPRLLGTAGAICNALPLLGNSFFTMYGDSYLPCDYRAVQNVFVRSGSAALMVVYRNNGRWDKSNVELVQGRIAAYDKQHQTPRMQHIDYGLGIFDSSAFDYILPGDPVDLALLYQRLLEANCLGAIETSQRFYEIGSLEGLIETRAYLSQETGPLPGGGA